MMRHRDENDTMCGFPGFCLPGAYNACIDTPLYKCSHCGMARSVAFLIFLVILGLAILLSNALVIISVFCNGRKAKTKLGYMKASLAVADLLNGILILAMSVPKVVWSMQSTSLQIDDYQILIQGSTTAEFWSLYLIFVYISTILNLLFMSINRFMTFKWPFWYMRNGNKVVSVSLALVWLISIGDSIYPMFYPSYFSSTYQPHLFIFSLATKELYKASAEVLALQWLAMLTPYFITTTLIASTAIIIRRQMHHYRKQDITAKQKQKSLHDQYKVIMTIAFMEIGFTITVIPGAIIVLLFYFDAFTCENISTPEMITFHMLAANSLVNVIVYSFRDANFRKTCLELKNILLCKKLAVRKSAKIDARTKQLHFLYKTP